MCVWCIMLYRVNSSPPTSPSLGFCVNRRHRILAPEPHVASLTREAARGHTDEPAKANYPPDRDRYTHQKQKQRKSKRGGVPKNWKMSRRNQAALRAPEDAASQIRRRSAGVPHPFRNRSTPVRSAPVPQPFRTRSERGPHRFRTGAAPVPHR